MLWRVRVSVVGLALLLVALMLPASAATAATPTPTPALGTATFTFSPQFVVSLLSKGVLLHAASPAKSTLSLNPPGLVVTFPLHPPTDPRSIPAVLDMDGAFVFTRYFSSVTLKPRIYACQDRIIILVNYGTTPADGYLFVLPLLGGEAGSFPASVVSPGSVNGPLGVNVLTPGQAVGRVTLRVPPPAQ